MSEFKLGSSLTKLTPEAGFSERARDILKDSPKSESTSGVGSSQSFLETLRSQFVEANQSVQSADKAAQDFATGRGKDLHDVMIAMEKADVAVRTVAAVRNKVVEAYQEIMRMPV